MSFAHFPFRQLLLYMDTITLKPTGVHPWPPPLLLLILTPPLISALLVWVPTVALKSTVPFPLLPLTSSHPAPSPKCFQILSSRRILFL